MNLIFAQKRKASFTDAFFFLTEIQLSEIYNSKQIQGVKRFGF